MPKKTPTLHERLFHGSRSVVFVQSCHATHGTLFRIMESVALARPRRATAGVLTPLPDLAGRPLNIHDRVLARYGGSAARFHGAITAVHGDGTFDIVFDDGDVETLLPLWTRGVDGPNIRHEDGSLVIMSASTNIRSKAVKRKHSPHAGRKVRQKPSPSPAASVEQAGLPAGMDGNAMHMGFKSVRVEAPVTGQDPRDNLQHRFTFSYTMRNIGVDGNPVVTEERVSLHDIVNNNDETMQRMHCAALYDFLVQLYTTPPTGFARMHALLGKNDPLGAFRAGEHERMRKLFARHAAAEDGRYRP